MLAKLKLIVNSTEKMRASEKNPTILMLVVDKVNLNYTTLTFSLFSDEENYMQVIMVNGYRSLM